MDPMKLITYVCAAAVVALLIIGGAGFYAGYSAGRSDLREVKSIVAQAAGIPSSRVDLSAAQPAAADLDPLLKEMRSLTAQIQKLERPGAPQPAEKIKEDPRLKEELAGLKQRLSSTAEQFNSCQQQVAALETRLRDSETLAARPAAKKEPQEARQEPGTVVLYDNVLLKKEQNKVYAEINMALNLQSVTSRSARVAVNRQNFGISFGERKVLEVNGVTCELVLMETDLENTQAKLSIACKR